MFETLAACVMGQVAVADVNLDGKLDMVATYDNQVAILLSAGDGTFASEQDFSTGRGIKISGCKTIQIGADFLGMLFCKSKSMLLRWQLRLMKTVCA